MNIAEQLQAKIDSKTKPLGALGIIEKLALQIGLVQNTLSPKLQNPYIVIFAADHGIVEEGVSAYPKEVTPQMVFNFLAGGAAINIFSKQNNISLEVVDAGVNYDFESNLPLINAKVAKGTKNSLKEKAMSMEQLNDCFEHAEKIVENIYSKNCNIIGFGEMGIGNTSAATLIMSYICKLNIEDCTGRGTGVNDAQLQQKIKVLQAVKNKQGELNNAIEILQSVGGLEIAQMCAAMLKAYEKNMLILVDGFIATSAFLLAHNMKTEIINNAIFCHQSDESGHAKALNYLGVDALLKLNMRVGEGTGCAMAYPIIQSAVNFLNEMASFESANVSNKGE